MLNRPQLPPTSNDNVTTAYLFWYLQCPYLNYACVPGMSISGLHNLTVSGSSLTSKNDSSRISSVPSSPIYPLLSKWRWHNRTKFS